MTTVDQLSVLLENQKGALAAVTKILGEAGYNILALSIAEIDTFGVCRLILPGIESAAALLRQKGYTVRITPVLVAEVPDRPNGLSQVLSIVQREDISLDYLYSFVRCTGRDALLIFTFSDNARAAEALSEKGVKLLSLEQVLAK